jgi:hypothetical protein
VLDSRGRAVGIIQAFFNPTHVDPSSLLSGPPARLNVATSMACVQTPVDSGTTYSSACNNMPGVEDERHTNAWLDSVGQRLQEDANAKLADWASGHPTGVRWKAASLTHDSILLPLPAPRTKYDMYLAPVPECVSRNTSSGSSDLSVPLTHYRKGYDEFLIPSYKEGTIGGFLTARLTLSPAGSGYQAQLVATNDQGRSVTLFQDQVGICR